MSSRRSRTLHACSAFSRTARRGKARAGGLAGGHRERSLACWACEGRSVRALRKPDSDRATLGRAIPHRVSGVRIERRPALFAWLFGCTREIGVSIAASQRTEPCPLGLRRCCGYDRLTDFAREGCAFRVMNFAVTAGAQDCRVSRVEQQGNVSRRKRIDRMMNLKATRCCRASFAPVRFRNDAGSNRVPTVGAIPGSPICVCESVGTLTRSSSSHALTVST